MRGETGQGRPFIVTLSVLMKTLLTSFEARMSVIYDRLLQKFMASFMSRHDLRRLKQQRDVSLFE